MSFGFSSTTVDSSIQRGNPSGAPSSGLQVAPLRQLLLSLGLFKLLLTDSILSWLFNRVSDQDSNACNTLNGVSYILLVFRLCSIKTRNSNVSQYLAGNGEDHNVTREVNFMLRMFSTEKAAKEMAPKLLVSSGDIDSSSICRAFGLTVSQFIWEDNIREHHESAHDSTKNKKWEPKVAAKAYDTIMISESHSLSHETSSRSSITQGKQPHTSASPSLSRQNEDPSDDDNLPPVDDVPGPSLSAAPFTKFNDTAGPSSSRLIKRTDLQNEGKHFVVNVYSSGKRTCTEAMGPFDAERWESLEKWLGTGLCTCSGAKDFAKKEWKEREEAESQMDKNLVLVHRMILTMIFARATRRINLAIRYWDDVAMEKAQGHTRDLVAADEHKRMILFLPMDSSFWQQEARLTAVLNLLDEAYHFHSGSCEVYPFRHEATSALAKILDVRALDAIAKDAPFNYAYRPCSKSQLADQETTIVKGTFSCAALHTRLVPPEKVDTLQSWGEVRVLMVGDKVDDEDTVFTGLRDNSSLTDGLVQKSRPGHQPNWVRNKTDRKANVRELKEFCLFWHF
ncbi:uncharacterized protein FSUBG_13735 [Fusarium subglutinans]|uniref:Uncharacterized protein n=1 Tax=Gibberella subglutinans TaxID=42677 RepID=A0A8H5KSW1_GIBSU|nr:uncharacterized protein FSUBG_13735 [Fusarium subglutinans]KAF5578717.1 hypothetical protein FSUBG_13735 [Fusarium subglutinans]